MHPLRPVVVDTNILFSSLLRSRTRFAEVLLQSGHPFYVCETVLVELFKRKEKILGFSRLGEDDLARLYHILLRRVNLFKEDLIAPEHWAAAVDLCQDLDPTDTPHVALTLALDGLLWTGDQRLRNGLTSKGFDRFFPAEG
jgi:predicted nucleic acid-binding protein